MSFFSFLPPPFSLELFGTARVAVLRDDDPLCRFSSVALQCANYHRVPLTGIYNTHAHTCIHTSRAHTHTYTRTYMHTTCALTSPFMRSLCLPHNRQSPLVCLAVLVAFFWFLVSSHDKDGFLPHSYSPPRPQPAEISFLFFRRLKYHCSYTRDVFGDAT
jgi:hypothetical protein